MATTTSGKRARYEITRSGFVTRWGKLPAPKSHTIPADGGSQSVPISIWNILSGSDLSAVGPLYIYTQIDTKTGMHTARMNTHMYIICIYICVYMFWLHRYLDPACGVY